MDFGLGFRLVGLKLDFQRLRLGLRTLMVSRRKSIMRGRPRSPPSSDGAISIFSSKRILLISFVLVFIVVMLSTVLEASRNSINTVVFVSS